MGMDIRTAITAESYYGVLFILGWTKHSVLLLPTTVLIPSLSAMQNLLAAAPIRPDFHFCDPSFSFFGHPLRLADCLQAEALMPRGAQLLRYHQPDQENLNELDLQFPLVYLHGAKCIHL